MKFLIAGSGGQLGREFVEILSDSEHEVCAPPEADLDITRPEVVSEAVESLLPNVLINCAAYNQVDKAEEDDATAMAVNAAGVENLAQACERQQVFLVHFGSDYVFDGTKEGLYEEHDGPKPVNKYGASKLRGEELLRQYGDRHLLFRVSWVFGAGQQNFLYKLSQWAKAGDPLKIVFDEVSVPTYTRDIVQMVLRAIEEELRGTYHLTNGGYATRYEFARHFLIKSGQQALVLPVPATAFPLPAKRPYFSAMSNKKLSNELGVLIPGWRDAVDRFARRGF